MSKTDEVTAADIISDLVAFRDDAGNDETHRFEFTTEMARRGRLFIADHP